MEACDRSGRRGVRRGRRWAGLGVAALLLTPSVALANAGGVMVWAFLGHFVIGNVVLGCIEGALLAGLAGLRRPWVAIVVMIGANFLSFFVGTWTIHDGYHALLPAMGGPLIDAVIPTLIVVALVAYALTVLVEWPACWLSMRRRDGPRTGWGRALVAGAAVNAVTCAMLVVWYFGASDLSLVLRTDRAGAGTVLAEAPAFDVYAIDRADGVVRRWSWDGTAYEPRAWRGGAPIVARRESLHTSPPVARAEGWPRGDAPLLLSGRGDTEGAAPLGEVQGRPGELMVWERERSWGDPSPRSFGPTRDLEFAELELGTWMDHRAAGERAWYPYLLWRGAERLNVRAPGQGAWFSLALRSPPESWSFYRPIALPGDVLLFETEGQILALHVPTRRLAYLCAGRSPVVLLRDGAGAE
jgi:hypothetical protein